MCSKLKGSSDFAVLEQKAVGVLKLKRSVIGPHLTRSQVIPDPERKFVSLESRNVI